jgi:mannose-6-phosphate isomerase-like protein (cupin superfamily)
MTGPPRSGTFTADDALTRLPGPRGERFVGVFRHGSLEIEYYAPRERDPQQPHSRDELYVVVSGRAVFQHDGRRTTVGPGDCLFVAAGVEHRFESFDDDFGAWVFFYGPEGGEAAGS